MENQQKNRREKNIFLRFESNFKFNAENHCWEWFGPKDRNGYGVFFIKKEKGKTRRGFSHRVSYELYRHKIPEGLLACHICDNPKCVNPDHIFLGTHKENTMDMIKKGRSRNARGEDAGHSKLSAKQVLEMRKLKTGGIGGPTYLNLAKAYGISKNSAFLIINRKSWIHI